MVVRKRKRTGEYLKKQKTVKEDEEITSESDLDENEVAKRVQDAAPDDSGNNAYETVEEKRQRLTQKVFEAAGLEGKDRVEREDEDDEAVGSTRELDARHAQQDDLEEESMAEHLRGFDGRDALQWGKRGHWLSATCVAMGDEDDMAVTGGKDSRVVVWDVETGVAVNTFGPGKKGRNAVKSKGHIGDVLAVAVGEGGLIASGGRDGMVRVWDVRAKDQVDCLKGHRGLVGALAFRRGSRQLFSGSADRTVKIWDLNEMSYIETLFGHGAEVNSLDSHLKERAVSCGADGTLRLYKVVEASQLVFRRARTTSLDCVSMMMETRFFSGGDDGAVCLWQANKKKPVAVVEHSHGKGNGCEQWVSSVAAIRGTDVAISGAGDGMVRFWKCKDPPALESIANVDVGGFLNGIAVSSSKRVVVAALGQEHRRGRWGCLKQAKNGLCIIRMPSSPR